MCYPIVYFRVVLWILENHTLVWVIIRETVYKEVFNVVMCIPLNCHKFGLYDTVDTFLKINPSKVDRATWVEGFTVGLQLGTSH